MPSPKLKINRPLKKGKLVLSAKDQADIKALYEYHKDGDIMSLTIQKYKKTRSNPQLRYYFAVPVKYLSEHLGYHVDEMHDLLKHMFNPKLIDVKGYCVEIGGSTGDLKTDEMEDYLSRIRMWASSELNLYIPLPNEVDF
jgi:hypothetical protein